MQFKKFDYQKDKKLTELRKICNACGSKAIKKTFSYLSFKFFYTKPESIISEYIPEIAYYVATINIKNIRLVELIC